MKKLIALFCVASAVTAFADTPAASDNVFGVLRVDIGDVEEAIIAVPWLDPGTGNPIKVTDVIKTANLNAGDWLYYYDTNAKGYKAWQLDDGKKWMPADVVKDDKTIIAVAGSEQTLERGNAILLKRSGTGTRATSVYLYGQVPTTSETTISIALGTSAVPAYTLLAPPADSNYDINAATWGNVGENDWVIISGAAPLNYNKETSMWGHFVVYKVNNKFVKAWTYDNVTVPAGQGIWFVSGSAENQTPSVTWRNLPSVGK